MKNYILSKTKFLDMDIKKVNYEFETISNLFLKNPNKIIIHHTGKQKTISHIIEKHVAKKKYSAIGYHFIIEKNGQIVYTRDMKYQGAHSYLNNKDTIGIALLGDFNIDLPTDKQLDSLKRLVTIIEHKYNISKVLPHNQIIYDLLVDFKLEEVNNVNILKFKNQQELIEFYQDITTKILKNNSSEEIVSILKRLTSCPGINLYPVFESLFKYR